MQSPEELEAAIIAAGHALSKIAQEISTTMERFNQTVFYALENCPQYLEYERQEPTRAYQAGLQDATQWLNSQPPE